LTFHRKKSLEEHVRNLQSVISLSKSKKKQNAKRIDELSKENKDLSLEI
jgi:hypothetical protein